MGARGGAVVEALRYKPEGRGIDSGWCHLNFSLTQSFRPHYGPGVDSASNRNEYQEYLHVPLGLKSGSLNLLEPSGPVKACNGIALPLHYVLNVHFMAFILLRSNCRWLVKMNWKSS
jgi:hypothetical protein